MVSIRIPNDVLFQEVGGEAVLLNLANGKYYGLDEVGTRMWTLIAQNGALEPVVQAMVAEYDVEPDRLQADLSELVDKLAEQGLLRVEEFVKEMKT